jgi:hypothetical protein
VDYFYIVREDSLLVIKNLWFLVMLKKNSTYHWVEILFLINLSSVKLGEQKSLLPLIIVLYLTILLAI